MNSTKPAAKNAYKIQNIAIDLVPLYFQNVKKYCIKTPFTQKPCALPFTALSPVSLGTFGQNTSQKTGNLL